jgi:hypothetical protein
MAHARRLRTWRDRRREAALAELRDKAQELEAVLPDLAPRVATMAERKGSVREVLQIGLRQGGHGRLAVFDVAPPDQEPRHDQGRQ